MKPQSSSDSFGAFLERMQRTRVVQGPAKTEPLTILHVLASKGALTMPQLLAESRVSLLEFSETLTIMRDAELVRWEGPAGDETVQLTPTGSRVAAIALEGK